MQKILRKRILRDFKANFFRYLALAALIILSMYLVISIVGAAEMIIRGVDEHAERNQLEDGEFRTFVPLTKAEQKELSGQGVFLEEMFYLDFSMEDAGTIRVFQNRNTLNLIELDEGRIAKNEGEAVLEKRYCEEYGWKVGDEITIGTETFQITGIGTTSDYDAPLKNLSDSTVDSTQFGTAFVNQKSYEKLKESGSSAKSEEYVYAYRRSETMTDDKLKKELQNLELSMSEVEDPYFKEYCREVLEKETGISDGMAELFMDSKMAEEAMNLSNLVEFLPAADNPRIKASADDQMVNKSAII